MLIHTHTPPTYYENASISMNVKFGTVFVNVQQLNVPI